MDAAKEMSLSEYLHKQLEVLVDCPKSATSKIEVAQRLGSFLSAGCLPANATAKAARLFHSPVSSDAFVTLQAVPAVTDPAAKKKPSGIQFPPIGWNSNFRKGYSLLFWIRIRGDAAESASSSSSTRQIIYRFSAATTGIQAMIESDSNGGMTFVAESLPQSATTTASPTSPQIHSSTLRIPIPSETLPINEWVLLSIQHTFPYLKRPFLALHLDGEEIGRGEIAFPDSTEYMTDVLFLANWERDLDVAGMGLYQDTIGSLTATTKDNSDSSAHNAATAKKKPPSVLQGLVYENGPLTGYGGAILPVIPAVVQARDAIVLDDTATSSNSGKGRKTVQLSATPHPSVLTGGAGRGLGIPLSVGITLPPVFDRHMSHAGIFNTATSMSSNDSPPALTLQRLLSKMIIGWSAAEDAMIIVGDGMTKVFLRLKIGPSLGNMNDLPKVGLVQPQEPESASSSKNLVTVLLKKKADDFTSLMGDSDVIFGKCVGNATLTHVSMEYLAQEAKFRRAIEGDAWDSRSFPTYHLPAFGTFVLKPIPRFVETFFSIHPLSYILLPFHQALPHPGYAYSCKHDYYRRSFKHLYDLVVYDGGALAAKLIDLLTAAISMGGKVREDLLQQGAMHILATLLRRVLLRASRLDMFSETSNKNGEALADILFKKFSSVETSESEFADFTSTVSSRPSKIPPLIVEASCNLARVLLSHPGRTLPCGTTPRPSIGVYIRRTSDLAIASIFGFILDFDLWGGDSYASSVMLKEFTDIFFPTVVSVGDKDHDVGLSWLIRGQLSVQYLLDLMRTYFSNDIIPDVTRVSSSPDKVKAQSLISIAQSLSRLMYSVLVYSLSSKALQPCEHDIQALVKTLCSCPLGSIGVHVVLTSLTNVLQYCEAVRPYYNREEENVPPSYRSSEDIRSILDQTLLKFNSDVKNGDLKKVKSEMVSRLARNLLVGQFHDIVASIVLSRTVFDGRRAMDSNSTCNTSKVAVGRMDTATVDSEFSWQSHWRNVLLLFVWVASNGGAEGQVAAKSTGSLLYQSGKAGTLNDCMKGPNMSNFVMSLVVPPPVSLTSAMVPVSTDFSQSDEFASVNDLSQRLRITINLLSGLISSLISKPTHRRVVGSDIGMNVSPNVYGDISGLEDSNLEVISSLIDVISSAYSFLHDVRMVVQVQDRNEASSLSKATIKAAKEALPSLLMSVSILETPIRELRDFLRRSYDSDANGSNMDTSTLKLRSLLDAQNKLLGSASTLILDAMLYGGGEAATAIWRLVIMTLSSFSSGGTVSDNEAGITEARSFHYPFLCRLVAFLFRKILSQMDKRAWESVSLCSATARLCDLVEEKNLLSKAPEQNRLSLDQVRLITAIIAVMTSGRHHAGWNQLSLQESVARSINAQSSITSEYDTDGFEFKLLSDIGVINNVQSKEQVCKFAIGIDDDILAFEYGVYRHINVEENVAAIQGKTKGTNRSNAAPSKLLLPILQPCLRISFECLYSIRSTDIILIAAQSDSTDSLNGLDYKCSSLLSLIDNELQLTMTAALNGLSFHSARDICMHALSSLSAAIAFHRAHSDKVSESSYRMMLLKAVEEMRIRYTNEKKRQEVALVQAYMDKSPSNLSDTLAVEREAENSSSVENLLLGDWEISKTDRASSTPSRSYGSQEDFVLFTGNEGFGSSITSPTENVFGWSSYKGFGAALENSADLLKSNNDSDLDSIYVSSEAILTNLSSFIDKWNEFQARDAAESEFVEIFDENEPIYEPSDKSISNSSAETETSEAAADAMSFYIELASMENSRIQEAQSSHMLSRRYGCVSFAEKSCWKYYFDVFNNLSNELSTLFESCMADGGRDYGSRLVTVPISPQFSRDLPKQLDVASPMPIRDLGDSIKDLVTSGNLTIVDITKTFKEGDDDELDDDMEDFKNLSMVDNTDIEVKDEDIDEGKQQLSDSQLVSSMQDSNKVDFEDEQQILVQSSHSSPVSMFSYPPDSTLNSASGGHGVVELWFDNVLHVRAEGSRKGTLYLTGTFLVFEYEDITGFFEGDLLALEDTKRRFGEENIPYDASEKQYRKGAAKRVKSMRWILSEISHVYLRRYRLRDSAIEMFFIPSGGTCSGGAGIFAGLSSVFLDFGPGVEGNSKRDTAANLIMKNSPPQTIKQWPDKSSPIITEQLRHLTLGWVKGRISNFDYLLSLNFLSGRSFNDLCQYPVFPWVLSNYTSEDIPDLTDPSNFRDLSKPMGALNPTRLKEFLERYRMFIDPIIPSFMYGSHYSTSAGVVLHFLVRLHPFGGLHRQLQSGHFDVADRLFHSIPRTWDMCTGTSAAEVKELTPEWYCNPSFLRNSNNFKLGTSQEGEVLGDVLLPPWAKGSPEKFIEIMRAALESDICTEMLPSWVDLIFGSKQQGPEAVKANNVFFYLTYYGSVDVSRIEDESLRIATELQIAHFGQCPMQLFARPHVSKLPRQHARRRLTLSELFGLVPAPQNREGINVAGDIPRPFSSAPIHYWINLQAPPPGPHAPLVAVRLAGIDRCLAVDAQGVFHSFRWSWKAEINPDGEEDVTWESDDLFQDKGFFIAQRELPHFRSIPRLTYAPPMSHSGEWNDKDSCCVVAISKSLFANHSLLLVISDGDGRGSLSIQLVDPAKGSVQKQSILPSIHSAKITCIHMDPFGIASGLGGVGGELALVGSEDGTASLWRFISSQYLPLRPKLRFGGHGGSKIRAVAVNSTLNVCVTVFDKKCCMFSITTGAMIRTFQPPSIEKSPSVSSCNCVRTSFADTNAVSLSVFGYLVLVCQSDYVSTEDNSSRKIISLELYSLEGIHVGSLALESWRGLPHKIFPTVDGRGIMICSGGGMSIHRISAVSPLEIVDQWQILEGSSLNKESSSNTFDCDFGPALYRPVVAVAACSHGELRFHALKGISEWSEDNKKGAVTEAMNNVLMKPAQKIKNVVGTVKGTGSRVVGLSKELGRGVKEKGASFFGGIVGRGKK